MRKFRFLFALAMVCLLTVAVFVPEAHASGPGDGVIQFSGTAFLPLFPCTGTCTGTFAGHITGALKGKDENGKWQVVFKKADMTSTYTYDEPLATCPESGTAAGSISTSGGSIVNAKYKNATVTGAFSTATFTWQRVGNAALVSTKFDLTLQTTTGNHKVLDDAPITTVALFATNGVPDCANPAATTATVVGVGVLAG